MKNTTLALFATIITLSGSAHALDLLVLKNYDQAAPKLWEKVKADEIPEALLGRETVQSPSESYSKLFPKTFFSEKLFAVCYQDCGASDLFRVSGGELSEQDKRNWTILEQSNIYYWVSRYFDFLEERIYFRPEKHLKVYSNRFVQGPLGFKMKNNAFFNPEDGTLSFLPASKNILYQKLNGKINRSGYDPSVIAHEASHFLFQELYPNALNNEMGGVNEGFADYIANVFMNNPKVGLIMMRGEALRDSSAVLDGDRKMKVYEPKLEVHDMGERVSYALWSTRAITNNPEEFDRLLIDAIKDLSKSPFSTVHDFKAKMLARLPVVVAPEKLTQTKKFWEAIFPGEPRKIDSFSAFPKGEVAEETVEIKTASKAPKEEKPTEAKYTVLQNKKISEAVQALLFKDEKDTPYWIIVDSERSNLVGIYDSEKNLVTEKKQIKDLSGIISKGLKAPAVISNFFKFANSISAFDANSSKGEIALSYKLKDRSLHSHPVTFNDRQLMGQRIQLKLKRKLLTGLLFGMPDLTSIDLITAPLATDKLVESNGQKVIGYVLTTESGETSQVLLSKFPEI